MTDTPKISGRAIANGSKPTRGATKQLAGKHNPLKNLKSPKTAKHGLGGHHKGAK